MATPHARPERFLVYSTAGSQRDRARDAREQPHWDEHAAFIDGLVAEGSSSSAARWTRRAAASWWSGHKTRSRRGSG